MNSKRAGTKHARYCWPTTLHRPPDAQLIYLDLNHWINLAKALSGHPDGRRHLDVLHRLLQSAKRGGAIFPISHSIFTEVLKIGDRRRRSDLSKVIERLSGFAVVTSRHVVATHEIEALFDHQIGPNPNPINAMYYLDWGVFRALGRSGNVRVLNLDGEDVTSAARQSCSGGAEEFDRIVKEHVLELNRRVLEGPAADDEADFRAQGYRPDRVLEQYDLEAAAENEFARRLDQEPQWRKGRLRDVVAARELAFQIDSIVMTAAFERGMDAYEDIFRGVNEPRRAFDAMPSFDVSVTLKTAIHRNAQHQWKNNHAHDIHALAYTLPYCDVVVTDREMAALVRRTKLDQRLGTSVLHNLEELTCLL